MKRDPSMKFILIVFEFSGLIAGFPLSREFRFPEEDGTNTVKNSNRTGI